MTPVAGLVLTAGLILTAGLLLTTGLILKAPAPTPPPAPAGPIYGSGISADSLANTQVGGTSCGCANLMTSYRFRASTSSALNSIRIYLIGPNYAGYGGGTGGTIEVTVQTDASGTPSGTTLATTTFTPGSEGAAGRVVTFPSPATLTAGQLYHIVFKNVDPSPTVNFASVNSLYVSSASVPRQPSVSDTDWAQLMNDGRGWQLRPQYTPILNLTYANGEVAGVGYMEVWVNSPRTISGNMSVREAFTVSSSDRQISSVAVRLRRTGGSSPLVVRLETATGVLIEQGTIPASSIGTSSSWATLTFASPHTLTKGQSYNVVLTSPGDTSYSIHAVREGPTYGYNPRTYFNDGYAQYTTGSGWTGFNGGTQGDLQFYLK